MFNNIITKLSFYFKVFSLSLWALLKLFETMVIVENKIILLPGNKNKVILLLIIKYKYLQQEKNFQFSKFKYIFIKQWVLH